MREVACLLVTNADEVLLESDDCLHYRLPQVDVLPGETPQEAVKRALCDAFDITSEAEDDYTDPPKGHGEKTHYTIFSCDAALLDHALKTTLGVGYAFMKNPLSLALDACAGVILEKYSLES